MFLSSTKQAQRERDRRTREKQLKRQVAGPIPPESWRDDFDRLSIRRGIASHLDRRRLHDLVSSAAALEEDTASEGLRNGKSSGRIGSDYDTAVRRRAREHRSTACAGLRHFYDNGESTEEGGSTLSLRDMSLCVIADALNCPAPVQSASGAGKDRFLTPDMDRTQIRDVLEYLPEHMRHRMLALCGRLAATDWPLSDWTAQALIDISKPSTDASHQSHAQCSEDAQDDWESGFDSDSHLLSSMQSASDTAASLDLSFSTISPRTIGRMLATLGHGQMSVSLRMLSLAGWNNTLVPKPSSGTSALDSAPVLTIFSQLPNLQTLCLARSSLSPTQGDSDVDAQRCAVFLRKLSRSLSKLQTLDLSFCRWVSADALLGVSWATSTFVAWPRLENLLLVGCESLADPRDVAADGAVSAGFAAGQAAGNHVAPWHATHSQRAMRSQPATEPAGQGTLYDPYTDTTHRDPFDLFTAAATTPATPRTAARATFGDYVNNTLRPAIISHMTASAWRNHETGSAAHGEGEGGVLMEFVRCPRSAGKVEMWQWQRARILEGVRGRTQPNARPRGWVEVWF